MLNRPTALAIVTLLTLAGFALRLTHLDSIPLRGDEAFSAQNWAGRPLAESLAHIATIEPHPPLTYVFFRAWGKIFGIDHELLLRLLPALSNLIGIPALYALGKRLHGRVAGILAALLWTFHPFQIWHAQDFRNYALWAGLSALSLWLALRVIEKRRPIDWLLYAIVSVMTVFTFYLELLAVGTLSLYVLIIYRHDRRFLAQWFALHAMIAAAIIATFLALQGQLIGSGSYAGTTGYLDIAQLITRFLPALNFGETMPVEISRTLGIVLLITLTGCILITTRHQRKTGIFLALLAVVPPIAIAVISLKMGVFDPRYALLASPAYVLLFCAGITTFIVGAHCHAPRQMYAFAAGAIALWLAVSFYSLNNAWNNPLYLKSANWNIAGAVLSEYVTENDLVIQTGADAAFGYYYKAPALDIALPDNFDQPAAEIESLLETYPPQYASIWTTGKTFESWQNAGVVEAWLDNHLQRTRSIDAGGIPVRQYMTWQVRDNEIDDSTLAVYGDAIELVGVRLFERPDPSGNITLWLYWKPRHQTAKPLKVFVHLAGDINPATGNPLWAQADSPPQQGRVDTDTWQPGTIYRDVYLLPVSDVAPGTYQLSAGFYDADSSERLLTETGADSFLIATLNLP